jgi:hypothetical protein
MEKESALQRMNIQKKVVESQNCMEQFIKQNCNWNMCRCYSCRSIWENDVSYLVITIGKDNKKIKNRIFQSKPQMLKSYFDAKSISPGTSPHIGLCQY